VRADEKLSAFIELERQVLTVTFYLASIHGDSCRSSLAYRIKASESWSNEDTKSDASM
jgi:hypothetical protein